MAITEIDVEDTPNFNTGGFDTKPSKITEPDLRVI